MKTKMKNLEPGYIVKESEHKIIDGKPARIIKRVELIEVSITQEDLDSFLFPKK